MLFIDCTANAQHDRALTHQDRLPARWLVGMLLCTVALLIQPAAAAVDAPRQETVILAFAYDVHVKPYPYDPEKAKNLLAEAGYPNGFEVRFLSTGADVLAQKQAAEAIQADLAKIGVRLKINHIEDTNSVVAQVKEGKAGPMFQWSWGYYLVFDVDQSGGRWPA